MIHVFYGEDSMSSYHQLLGTFSIVAVPYAITSTKQREKHTFLLIQSRFVGS